MSLEKKIALGLLISSAAGMSSCKKNTYSTTLDGVTISEAVTDSKGRASLIEAESEEEVNVDVTIQGTNFPVSDARVTYFDGSEFKGFLLSHPAFAPQLQIASHNSDHFYSLTPAALPVLHESNQKEQSHWAAVSYLTWAEANWQYTGCLNHDNMVTLMKPGVFMFKKLGVVETLGIPEDAFDKGVDYQEKNLPETAVADMYVFIPSQQGMIGTTTITALDFRFNGKCYDAPPVQQNTECEGTVFCDTFSGNNLESGKWKIVKDAGIKVSGGWLSLTNPSSIATIGWENSCKDKQVDLRSGAWMGSVYLGNMGLSAGKTTGILSCDKQSKTLSLSGAQKGMSLYQSGGNLSVVVGGVTTSVPCSENITYVQLSAGVNQAATFDYVKVRCK